MKLKPFFNFIRSKFFWVNVATAIVIVTVVCTLFLWWLKAFTHHNEGVKVPDLCGLYIEEAELKLHDMGLSYEIIDSVYLKSANPGEITEQSPAKGMHVKQNRKIYLTINAKGARMVAIPDLRNLSSRQARITLLNMGFYVDSCIYKPSEFADLVMDIRSHNNSLAAGTMMKEGTHLVLVVGTTESNEEVIIPDFKGMVLDDAKAVIADNQLIIGIVDYDTEPTADSRQTPYYVYDQDPAAGEVFTAGKRVNLWFSKDRNHKPRKAKSQDEDFFN